MGSLGCFLGIHGGAEKDRERWTRRILDRIHCHCQVTVGHSLYLYRERG